MVLHKLRVLLLLCPRLHYLMMVVVICLLDEKERTISAAFLPRRMRCIKAPGRLYKLKGASIVTLRGLQNQKNLAETDLIDDTSQRPQPTRETGQANTYIQKLIQNLGSAMVSLVIFMVSLVLVLDYQQQAVAIQIDDKIVKLEQAAIQQQEQTVYSRTKFLTNNYLKHSKATSQQSYWEAQMSSNPLDVVFSNERLFEVVLRTINTNYYDHTGGFNFSPEDFYVKFKKTFYDSTNTNKKSLFYFDNRIHAVQGLKRLANMINDPYSKYLTRQELQNELSPKNNHGFLGIGAIVSKEPTSSLSSTNPNFCDVTGLGSLLASAGECGGVSSPTKPLLKYAISNNNEFSMTLLSHEQVANLPVVTAVEPLSPAERSGIVVGDRIVAVGSDNLLGLSSSSIFQKMKTKYLDAENYFGYTNIIIAKPVFDEEVQQNNFEEGVSYNNRELLGYSPSRVKIATESIEPFSQLQKHAGDNNHFSAISGGDNICYWQLLTPANSIVYTASRDDVSSLPTEQILTGFHNANGNKNKNAVGYIRLTRFSKLSTLGFIQAVQNLESFGAQSYIIDVRNNYGGVVQEAMLTASTLLRNPESVLCFTLNSRGEISPHLVGDYAIDERYPGYLLSSEPRSTTINLMKTKVYAGKDRGWMPIASAPSIVHKAGLFLQPTDIDSNIRKEKKIVILVNEGTASSAEVFISSLRDNGRTVALVGAKTFGKGLIQHTFPTPDGGGIRLTVAEYLTPKLQHVTNVGGARFSSSGNLVGGGVTPDIFCETKGIPTNTGADLCVGIALDALDY